MSEIIVLLSLRDVFINDKRFVEEGKKLYGQNRFVESPKALPRSAAFYLSVLFPLSGLPYNFKTYNKIITAIIETNGFQDDADVLGYRAFILLPYSFIPTSATNIG